MTTTQSREAQIDAFINSNAVQDKLRILVRNCNEMYVAEKLNVTRREARIALKLTGRY